MSSSETGPAVMPSGGDEVRARYSEKRRRDATEVGAEGGLVVEVLDEVSDLGWCVFWEGFS